MHDEVADSGNHKNLVHEWIGKRLSAKRDSILDSWIKDLKQEYFNI
jgi:hypothetical protein